MPDANMPAFSLKGNLSSSPAPVQDVPLASVAGSGNPLGDTIATTVSIARAQIPSRVIPLNAFRVAGYNSLGDGGEGAVYIRGSADGPGAIQDASGTWFQIDTSVPGINSRWFGGVRTTVDIGAGKTAILLAPGAEALSQPLVIQGQKVTRIIGVASDLSVLVPAPGTSMTALVSLVGANNIELEHFTINTGGYPTQCVAIDRGSSRVTFTAMTFAGDIGARTGIESDLIYNEGDTTIFKDCYWYGADPKTWALNFGKDAQSPKGFPAGNNHLVLGGNIYGGGSTPGTGCCGIRITQRNKGTKTKEELRDRRVEGVRILGVNFITDGPTNVSIGNSLYVAVSQCICDQTSHYGIVVGDGADCYIINDNYIGTIPSYPDTRGVYLYPTAGLNGQIDNNQFVNLHYGVLADATAQSCVDNGLSVTNNKAWLTQDIAYVLDSVQDATFTGNVDYRYNGGASLWIKNSYQHPSITISNNRLSPYLPSSTPAFDPAGDYRGSGNSGWWAWLGATDRGVRLGSLGQSIPQATKTKLTAWNVERNTDAAWDPGNSQIVIPAWCNLARFDLFGEWSNNSTGARSLTITDAANNDFAADDRSASGVSRACLSTGLMAVTPGSVWTFQATQTSGGALTLGGITHATVEFRRVAV